MLSNPIEMFQYLYNKDIGTNWALFYEARALLQENCGKYKDAEDSFKLGINRKAMPVDHLKYKYSQFTNRMEERVKIIMAKREEKAQEERLMKSSSSSSSGSGRSSRTSSSSSSSSSHDRRKTGLSAARKSGKTLSYSTMPVVPLQDKSNSVISVLCDEKPAAPIPNNVKIEWNEFATEETSMKENVLGASAWTGKTLPQKRSKKPAKVCNFSIYIDPECKEELTPPNDNINEVEDDDIDFMQMIKDIKMKVKNSN